MKFLLDENLSPVLRDLLVESGLDVIHVRDLQMSGSKDEEVRAKSRQVNRDRVGGSSGQTLWRTVESGVTLLVTRHI